MKEGKLVGGIFGNNKCSNWIYRNVSWVGFVIAVSMFAVDIAITQVLASDKVSTYEPACNASI